MYMYTNMAFWTEKSVLFIEVSLFQGVLIRGVPLLNVSMKMLQNIRTTRHHISYQYLYWMTSLYSVQRQLDTVWQLFVLYWRDGA